MTNLSPLIEKIEAAEEGSRYLDIDLVQSIYDDQDPLVPAPRHHQPDVCKRIPRTWWERWLGLPPTAFFTIPQYTTSIDAIVGLIEKEGFEPTSLGWTITRINTAAILNHEISTAGKRWVCYNGKGHTPALALCAAFLRAVQAKRSLSPDTEKG